MHVGFVGFGSIGQSVHTRLSCDPAFRFSALLRSRRADMPEDLNCVSDLDTLLNTRPDLILECAGHSAVQAYGADILNAGIPLIIASVGALSDAALETSLKQASATPGARLILPSGAIGGLDILRALAREGSVDVTYRGVKPPAAWKGSPADDLINLDAIETATPIFSGTGREVARAFPKNANVVAALALSGAGFDRMQAELIADPAATGNTHSYHVTAPTCRYEMTIESTPSGANARTSQTTALSIVEEIQRFKDHATT